MFLYQDEWKQQRKTVLICLERFLHQTHTEHACTEHARTEHDMWMQIHGQVQHMNTQPVLVLLDDNFYYQSMRYQIYQLARKCMCSSVPDITKILHQCFWHSCFSHEDRLHGLLSGVRTVSAWRLSPEEPVQIPTCSWRSDATDVWTNGTSKQEQKLLGAAEPDSGQHKQRHRWRCVGQTQSCLIKNMLKS